MCTFCFMKPIQPTDYQYSHTLAYFILVKALVTLWIEFEYSLLIKILSLHTQPHCSKMLHLLNWRFHILLLYAIPWSSCCPESVPPHELCWNLLLTCWVCHCNPNQWPFFYQLQFFDSVTMLTRQYRLSINLYQQVVIFSCAYMFHPQKLNNWADFFLQDQFS